VFPEFLEETIVQSHYRSIFLRARKGDPASRSKRLDCFRRWCSDADEEGLPSSQFAFSCPEYNAS